MVSLQRLKCFFTDIAINCPFLGHSLNFFPERGTIHLLCIAILMGLPFRSHIALPVFVLRFTWTDIGFFFIRVDRREKELAFNFQRLLDFHQWNDDFARHCLFIAFVWLEILWPLVRILRFLPTVCFLVAFLSTKVAISVEFFLLIRVLVA